MGAGCDGTAAEGRIRSRGTGAGSGLTCGSGVVVVAVTGGVSGLTVMSLTTFCTPVIPAASLAARLLAAALLTAPVSVTTPACAITCTGSLFSA